MSVWHPAFFFSIAGTVLAWVHRFADIEYGEDEPLLILWGFVILGSICKLGFLCCVPFLLRRTFLAMHQDVRRTSICVVCWAVAAATLITIFTVFHDNLTEILNNDAVRFYPVSGPSTQIDGHYIGRESWLRRWQSGQVLALEAGFALALIVLLLGIGYGWKNRAFDRVGYTKIIVACLLLYGVCVAWPHAFQLINWDYDVFLGTILSSSLALDNIVPSMVVEPSSQITFLAYLAFTISTYAALRLSQPKPDG